MQNGHTHANTSANPICQMYKNGNPDDDSLMDDCLASLLLISFSAPDALERRLGVEVAFFGGIVPDLFLYILVSN